MLASLLLIAACTEPIEDPTDVDSESFVVEEPVPQVPPTIEEMVAEIDRSVSPTFIYPYEQTRFVPPDGKTLLIMGQTVERIDEYVAAFPYAPSPGGWSAYWGIPEFAGITEPHVNEFGTTMHHQGLVDDFPNAVVHSAMWMVGTWGVADNTADGVYDEVIDQYSAWANSVDRPIFLRIGYEFDGPHNELPPDVYVDAYRHVVDRMRAAGVDNVAFVWHSYASPPFQGHPVSAWYPGDDYVDWVGISVFGHMYAGGDSLGAPGDAVLAFAKEHHKPVMIAESSPVNGISPYDRASWRSWFVPFFSFVHRHNIKAVAFISEDWTAMDFPGVTWEDARLTNNPTIAEAWLLETSGTKYLHASEELFSTLGYPVDVSDE